MKKDEQALAFSHLNDLWFSVLSVSSVVQFCELSRFAQLIPGS
jgi:hypothetical protein